MKNFITIILFISIKNLCAQTDSINIKYEERAISNKMYKQGQADAARYYKKYKSAGTGVLMTGTLLTPVVGLIPAIGASSTPVKDENLNVPDRSLFTNDDYQDGYISKANKKKKARVWMNWGISWVSFAIVYGVIRGIVSNSN